MGEEQFRKTIADLKNILKYENEMRQTFGTRYEIFKRVIPVIEIEINRMIRGEEFESTDQTKSVIRESLNLIVDAVLVQDITKILKDFASLFTILVFNWSKMLGKREDIERDCNMVTKMLKMQMSIEDSIEINRKYLRRLNAILKVNPPAFEVAKHYLLSLKGKKEECKEEEKKAPVEVSKTKPITWKNI